MGGNISNMNKVRLNQNFSRYSSLIGMIEQEGIIPFKENKEIVKNLLFYFSELEQKGTDMFGLIEFDIYKFCKEFGYKTENLQRKVTNDEKSPFERAIPIINQNEKHIVTNTIENVLFDIASKSFPIQIQNEAGMFGLKFISVIDEIYIGFNEEQKNKRTYFIKLKEDYKRSFLNYYHTTDPKLYKSLKIKKKRTKGLQDLYLKLEIDKTTLIAKKGYAKQLGYFAHFDSLCKVADINQDQEPKYIKRDLKAKLKALQDLSKINNETQLKEKGVSSDFNFEFEWVKNGKYDYKIKILFIFSDSVLKLKKEEEEKSANLLESLFKQILAKEYESTSKKHSLVDWLKNDKLSSDLKRSIYANEYFKTYNRNVSEIYLNKRFD